VSEERIVAAIHMEHFRPFDLEVEIVGYEVGLSVRQRQLCTGLLAGLSHSEIAVRMAVKESTVTDHVRETYRKLQVHTRRELVQRFRDGISIS
jgi:DNA-binding NarL/FixJ family response regulator